MKIGYLFPGQGAQSVGMGKDLYEEYKDVREVYDNVKKITGIDVAEISFNGPEEMLNQTKYTQICILTMSLAILKLLEKENIKAEISSGLSLGEYSALIYSKILEFEDGIKIVKKRGEYMQELVPEGNWSMAAVLGMSEEDITNVCKKVTKGFAVPVNFNCPGQIVVSGDEEGILKMQELAKEAGAKKVRILNTAGPFHTEKLVESAKALRKELENININSCDTKVAKNLDGKIYANDDNVREILEKHIINPVRFSNCLETMISEGIDTFIEIGPGKTLTGFLKRIETDKEIKCFNINNVESFKNVINTINE